MDLEDKFDELLDEETPNSEEDKDVSGSDPEDSGDDKPEDDTGSDDEQSGDEDKSDTDESKPEDKEEPKEPEVKEPEKKDDTPEVTADSYALDKLPEITVRGAKEEGGQVEEFTIKTAADLPDGFVPESYKAQAELTEKLAQNTNALNYYKNEFVSNKEKEVLEAQDKEIADAWESDLAKAQADKRIPEIKVKDGDPNYWEDEGVKKTAEVIQFMKDYNDGIEKSGGKGFISSLSVALDLYELKQIKDEQKKQESDELQTNKTRGSLVGGGKGSTSDVVKSTVPPGTTVDDIINKYEDEL